MKTKEPCPFCGAPLLKRIGEHHYKESGLPYVLLQNVTISECPECGEGGGVEIPNIIGLHKLLVNAIIRKPSRLASFEIRFLRKSLGWSSKDFAKKMNVKPETVSRWESDDAPKPMAVANDRLLRLYVAQEKPIENYSIHDSENLTDSARIVTQVPVKFYSGRWSAPQLQAAAC